MIGFLLKVFIVAAIVVGAFSLVYLRRGIPIPKNFSDLQGQIFNKETLTNTLKNVDTSQLGKQLSDALDALVTHPDKNSPVVLGVKVTNESLSTVVGVIQNLPTNQLDQIKTAICK